MEGRFLRGVLVGGIVGATLVSQWDTLMKKCPFLEELKGNILFDRDGKPYRNTTGQSRPTSRTRLMARRHRVG